MKGVLNWMKANPVNLVCVVVILISISSLFWLAGPLRGKLAKKVEERPRELSQLETMINRSVAIPNDDPNEPIKTVRITVNGAAVDQLEKAYKRMNEDYKSLFADALAFNQSGADGSNPHDLLVADALPKPSPARANQAMFDARSAYQERIAALYQQLGATQPPTATDLEEKKEESSGGGLVDDPNLLIKQKDRRMNKVLRVATNAQVYGQPAIFGGKELANDGLFTIGKWVRDEIKPTVEQVWDGQMEIWLQQDVIAAITRANTDPDGRETNILTNPVKRVIKIEVVGGYVMPEASSNELRNPDDSSDTAKVDLNKPLPKNFAVSETGRVSNPLYDVRHVNVSLVVDMAQLPRVLNAFTEVNLNTPIIRNIRTIDQATALRTENVVYGNNVTVAQVDLLIESLWLRRWTAGHIDKEDADKNSEQFDAGLMPDAVRVRLGMKPRSKDFLGADEDGEDAPNG